MIISSRPNIGTSTDTNTTERGIVGGALFKRKLGKNSTTPRRDARFLKKQAPRLDETHISQNKQTRRTKNYWKRFWFLTPFENDTKHQNRLRHP